MAGLRKISGETVSLGSWMKNYPVGVGAPTIAMGGGALGLLYHLTRRAVDKKYKGSGTLAAALGLGVGAVAGGAYAASRSPHGIPQQLETEIDNAKYDRFGPFRQALRAARPLMRPRPSDHDYPADFRAAVKNPLTTLPDSVAYGGHVAPNDLRISVSNRPAPATGLWREGFEGGRPKKFLTLDGPLEKLFGPPKDSTSFVGSEVLGSRSQFDYNEAVQELFKPEDADGQLPPAPLRPTDHSVTIAGHASSNPLSSVAGVTYQDILSELAKQGRFRNTNFLELRTCNSEGCDIPNEVVKPALGEIPARLSYTPAGGSGTAEHARYQRRFIREPDAAGVRPMDQNWVQPKRITTVGVGAEGKLAPVEPGAQQTLVSPRIPTGVTRQAGNVASLLTAPFVTPFTGNPDLVGSRVRDLAKPRDFVVNKNGVNDITAPATWDRSATLLPKLRAQRPKWFPDDPYRAAP